MDSPVNWESPDNHILLNDRWPENDREFLRREGQRVLSERGISGHLVVTSSGTTAESRRAIKLIFISKEAFLAAARSVVSFFGFGERDVFAQSLPLFHVGGLGVRARAFLAGGRVVEMPAWSRGDCLPWLSDNEVSVLSLVPAQIHDLVAVKAAAPSSMRTVFVGAGALSPSLEKQAKDLGWPLVATFGMTETSAMVAVRTGIDEGFRPLSRVEGALNADGFLKLRAPGLATGVLRWTDTGAHWDPVKGADDWFQTQDRVLIEDDRWRILGRDRDFIKISGESVSLEALRGILSNLLPPLGLSSTDFHLIAFPQARTGFEVGLVVQPQGASRAPRVKEAFDRLVLPFERIRRIVELEEIPRTELGKVREAELKRRLEKITGRP